MSRGFALVLVLVFLTASCVMVAKPVSGASAVGNTWVSNAPMPTARGGLGVAVVNGKIYAIGGSTETVSHSLIVSGGVVGINEEYNPATDNWTTKAPMPTPRAFFAIAVYQNKIYCIGGVSWFPNNGKGEQITGVNQIYDPATDTWTTKSPMPLARFGLQANCVDGKIYLIDGEPNGTLNEVYDPANDSWTTKSSMPTPTAGGYTSTILDNKIYVIGTRTEIYDSERDNWTSGASPPYSLTEPVAVATDGIMAPKLIYVFSGWAFDSEKTQSNQIYDPMNDSWVIGADIPTNRIQFGVAVVNDTLYVIGGIIRDYPIPLSMINNDTPIAVNQQYTPVGYGTPDSSYVLETSPPKISLLSPIKHTYNESSVPLVFTTDKSVNWAGYSLDGKQNVTLTGNSTVANMTNGLHSITVYANDTFGNFASQTISFTIAKPEPFPTATVAAISGASAVVVAAGLMVYFKKRKPATHRIIEGQSFD
jgi:N-acetylneuraminic acid mutarotase